MLHQPTQTAGGLSAKRVAANCGHDIAQMPQTGEVGRVCVAGLGCHAGMSVRG